MSEPTKWWYSTNYDHEPQSVDVIHETPKTITIATHGGRRGGRRTNKFSDYCSYFPTKAASVEYRLRSLRSKLNNAKHSVKRCQEAVDKFEATYG